MMKKAVKIFAMVLIAAFAMGCAGSQSDKAEAEKSGQKAESTAEETQTGLNAKGEFSSPRDGIAMAKKILKDIKEDGKDMSVDELKEKLLVFAKAVKPMVTDINAIAKTIEDDPSKAAEALKKAEKIEKVFTPLMQEMEDVTKDLPAYKEIENDEAFEKELLEAMGMPTE